VEGWLGEEATSTGFWNSNTFGSLVSARLLRHGLGNSVLTRARRRRLREDLQTANHAYLHTLCCMPKENFLLTET
jgi:hypothetical protein